MSTRHERPLKRTNPSGRTVWVARYTGRDGKRRSAGTFKRQGDAQDAINAAYRQQPDSSRPVTVGEYAATWTARHPRSYRTDLTNDQRLSAILGPVTKRQLENGRKRAVRRGEKFKPWGGVMIEGFPLRDWTLRDVRRRQVSVLLDVLLRDQGRAALGAKGILLTLSAMFEDAINDEVADANPVKGVKVRASDPRVTKEARKPRVVSWEQMHALARAAGGYEAAVRVAADCGLRLGELLGLYRDDMKLGRCDEAGCVVEGSHFHVRRTTFQGEVEDGTKRERLRQVFESGRAVPIPAPLEVLLRAMPRRIDTPLLFPAEGGAVFWEHNFRLHVWNVARSVSGVDATPQDFRHSWVTHLRAAGVDPADLAAMAGHSVQVATQVYTHALHRSFEDVRRAVGE